MITLKPRLQQLLRPRAWKPLTTTHRLAGGASVRRNHDARLQELRKADALKYPRIQHQDAAPPMRIPVFREKYQHVKEGEVIEGEEVVVHGRLQSIRRAGSKLAFLVLRNEFEDLQGMCNVGQLEAAGVDCSGFKSLVQLLNKGDIISLKGKATRTSTGELTMLATGLPQLLTPSLVPLPFQVLDQNLRFHNRHIDLLTSRRSIDTLRLRSHIIKYIRDFLHERGFLEFQTPILAENAGGAIARPFVTPFTEGGSGASAKSLAMRIAPELWLKRLVVGGVDKVFELGPSFRNEGIDQTHNPEFTTCEFYNAYASLDDLIRLTEHLILGAASHCQSLISTKLDSLPEIDTVHKFPPGTRFKQMEFIPSLESALGFTLPDLESPTALQDLISLLRAYKQSHILQKCSEGGHPSTLPKLLDDLAAAHIEPYSRTSPIFITHHPVCMSPLSKSFICPKTGQHVSARTELFIDGMELANMYEEENDPFAQRDKFIQQATRHRDPSVQKEVPAPSPSPSPSPSPRATGEYQDTGADTDVIIDESYVHALESGLPPTGGWGCGIERLVMLFAGTRRISDCLSFGNVRNVVGVSSQAALRREKHRDDEHKGKQEGEGEKKAKKEKKATEEEEK